MQRRTKLSWPDCTGCTASAAVLQTADSAAVACAAACVCVTADCKLQSCSWTAVELRSLSSGERELRQLLGCCVSTYCRAVHAATATSQDISLLGRNKFCSLIHCSGGYNAGICGLQKSDRNVTHKRFSRRQFSPIRIKTCDDLVNTGFAKYLLKIHNKKLHQNRL